MHEADLPMHNDSSTATPHSLLPPLLARIQVIFHYCLRFILFLQNISELPLLQALTLFHMMSTVACHMPQLASISHEWHKRTTSPLAFLTV